MLAPNRKSKGRGGGREGGREAKREVEEGDEKKRRKRGSLLRPLSPPPSSPPEPQAALPGTYCGAAVHCGALTSVNMSYCLPTWQKSFPVSTHPLASPNRCH